VEKRFRIWCKVQECKPGLEPGYLFALEFLAKILDDLRYNCY